MRMFDTVATLISCQYMYLQGKICLAFVALALVIYITSRANIDRTFLVYQVTVFLSTSSICVNGM